MQRKTKTAPRKSKRDVPVLLCEYPVSTLVFEDEIDVINVDPVVVPSGCRRLPYVREPVETSSSVREPVETSSSVREPVETSSSVREPVETSSSVREPVETSSYVREPVETSSSVREPVEFLASSIQCGCGSWITSKTKSKHLKTKKHGLWMLGQPCADCVV